MLFEEDSKPFEEAFFEVVEGREAMDDVTGRGFSVCVFLLSLLRVDCLDEGVLVEEEVGRGARTEEEAVVDDDDLVDLVVFFFLLSLSIYSKSSPIEPLSMVSAVILRDACVLF